MSSTTISTIRAVSSLYRWKPFFAQRLVEHASCLLQHASTSTREVLVSFQPVANSVTLTLTHRYGSAFNHETNTTQQLLMDFYAPPPHEDKRTKRPTIVLVHGGSFIGGDKGSWKPLATVLAQRGFVVGSINYRLTGKYVVVVVLSLEVFRKPFWLECRLLGGPQHASTSITPLGWLVSVGY
jgi:acetyl esterase/lipase